MYEVVTELNKISRKIRSYVLILIIWSYLYYLIIWNWIDKSILNWKMRVISKCENKTIFEFIWVFIRTVAKSFNRILVSIFCVYFFETNILFWWFCAQLPITILRSEQLKFDFENQKNDMGLFFCTVNVLFYLYLFLLVQSIHGWEYSFYCPILKSLTCDVSKNLL